MIEGFYVEIYLRNNKWLINCSYNPHENMIGGDRLRALSEKLDVYSSMLILMAISILRWSNNRLRLFVIIMV